MQQQQQPLAPASQEKYVMRNGIMELNPQWVDPTPHPQRPAYGPATAQATASQQQQAIVSTPEDVMARNAAMQRAGMAPQPMAPSFGAAITHLQDPAVARQVGLTPGNIVDHVSQVFARLEAPLGLVAKLEVLQRFQLLEFIVDDSGSMGRMSNATQTRFQEAESRLLELFEVLAAVPKPEIRVYFLNRPNVVQLQHQPAETPAVFMQRASAELRKAFSCMPPGGGTPILQKLSAVFAAGAGYRVSRYLMCDGEPDGGATEISRVCQLVSTRPAPQDNPLTLMSCTNEDELVEWMKTLEGVADFVAEFDDYGSEAQEVREEQGRVLPFPYGYYVVGELVAANFPEDMDAMDEPLPLTKFSYDGILGVSTTPQEYRRYWDGFVAAQRAKGTKRDADAMDRYTSAFHWDETLFADFSRVQSKMDIPRVVAHKAQMKRIFEAEHGHGAGSSCFAV